MEWVIYQRSILYTETWLLATYCSPMILHARYFIYIIRGQLFAEVMICVRKWLALAIFLPFHLWHVCLWSLPISCRLVTLAWPETLRMIITSHMEELFQSSGLPQRWGGRMYCVLCYIFIIFLPVGIELQQVFNCQWCVELWDGFVWDMESGREAI